VESTKITISVVQVNSALVSFVEIVADMNEAGALEGIAIVANFSIGSGEAREPIVGDSDARNALPLAAVLEAALAKYSELLNCEGWLSIWIRRWEDVSIVQEYDSDAIDDAFVNAQGSTTVDVNCDVVLIVDAGWVFGEIASLPLPVSFVVR